MKIDMDALEQQAERRLRTYPSDDLVRDMLSALSQQQEEIERLGAENIHVRGVVEEAPHDSICGAIYGHKTGYKCDCWKSKALSSDKESGNED